MKYRGIQIVRTPLAGAMLLALAATVPTHVNAQEAEAGAGALEEVMVTAQRREERLLDVPISISSLSEQQLDAAVVTGLFDLNTVVPGLRVDHYGAYAQPTIRGIGTQDVQGPGANANVAIYMDGFYMPSQAGNLFEFTNIERVDVLKGPQGTLFGQNATGGAILIKTPDPQFESSGHFRLAVGSWDDRRASVYGTTGLSDTFAMDWSLYYRESDNYFDNIATGEPTAPLDYKAARGKLLWMPSDTTKWVLTLEYTDINDPTGLAQVSRQPIAQFYNDAFGVPIVHTIEPYKNSFNYDVMANPQAFAAQLHGEFDLAGLDVNWYTQYRDQEADIRADLDGTTVQYWQVEYTEKEKTFTQEINIGNAGEGRLDWVAGVFYYHDVGSLRNNAYNDFFNTGTRTNWLYSDAEVTTDSIGVYADGVFEFAEDWFLTLGGRFTSEEKELVSQGLLDPFVYFTDSERWTEFTPRVVLRHQASDISSLYASVSRGFMSGNYIYTQVGPQTPVDPEEITQYEIGYKVDVDGWTFDTAVYFSDYDNLQVYIFNNECACFVLDNAPKAETYGWEAHFGANLTDNLTVNMGVAYTHAEYKEYIGQGISGDPYFPPSYGFAVVPTDFSGRQMIRTPEWTSSVALNYVRPLASGGSLDLSGNYYWTDDIPLSPGNELTQDSYGLLALRAGWTSEEGTWGVSVYGNNVLDEEYLIFSAAGFLGNNHIYGAPASWGVQVDYRY